MSYQTPRWRELVARAYHPKSLQLYNQLRKRYF